MPRSVTAALVVLLLGGGCTLLVYQALRQHAQRTVQAEFDLGARDRMLAVQREFSEDLAALSALSAFYAASERVERAEFRAFVADTLARRPSIRALEWEPRLSTDRRAAHEAATRAEGFPDYMIRDLAPSGELVPAATREEYFPVWYVEPFQGNENVMGFDPTSEPRRKAALERARDTGRPVASEPITLVQRTHRTTGMLVYLAVYDEPETPEAVRTTAWRREHLAGMVVMVAGIPAAVEGALARFSRGGLRLELWDATETPARLIYCQPLETGQEVVPEVATETEFTLAERRWRLAATATRGFVAARRGRGPEAGLAVGCALTLLLAAFLANLVGRSQRVERLVAERTASLAAEVAERRRIAEVLSLRDRAIAAAANGIVICDARRPDLPILDVNPAFEAITGYAKADVLGRNCRFLQGEDRDQPALTFVRRALSEGRDCRVTLRNYRADGRLFWNDLHLSPIRDAEGRLTHYVGVQNDITERVRAEEALYEANSKLYGVLAAATEVSIIATDTRGLITVFNAGAERMLGWRAAEMIGKTTPEVIHDPEEVAEHGRRLSEEFGYPIDGFAAFVERARRGGHEEREWTYVRRDGSRLTVNLVVTALRDAAGEITGFLGVATDITRRKEAEEALRAAKEAAEAASREKSRFLANMSHELRTPLNSVMGYSEMLQLLARRKGLEEFIPDLARIHASGEHLLRLINDILDLSKVEAGRLELSPEIFSLATLLSDVAATVEPLAARNANRFQLDVPDQPGEIYADPTRLRQILLNLLGNACKFTEAGVITLHARRSLCDGRPGVLVQVRDTGIGMTPEELARVFEPFVQADGSTTRKYGGTGLGLSIAKRLCESMGGRLSAESAPQAGTCFTLWLPAAAEEGTVVAAPPAAPDGVVAQPAAPDSVLARPAAPADTDAGGTATILVIDDEPAARDLLCRTLTEAGLYPVAAAGGEEGLALARTLHPAAIVLDVIMPRMDGWSVLRRLKRDPGLADIPVVLATMVDQRRMGLALGAADYLTKPIPREHLIAALRRHLPPSAGRRILVVEDDEPTRRSLSAALREAGFVTFEAEHGGVALERLDAVRPDAIVLDLLMPEMDGFQFAAALRERPDAETIPVIVLTAKDLSREERERLRGSVEAILQKGAGGRQALVAEVRHVLARAPGGGPHG